MSENPATWGAVEKVLAHATEEFQIAQAKGMCGFSYYKYLAEELRNAGLLREEVVSHDEPAGDSG